MLFHKKLLYFRGRVALSELLIASDIKEGDQVALQAFTCSAVPEAVFASGSKPLYIDVIDHGITMCPNDLEIKLQQNKDVKVLIIQHTFGIADNIDELIIIARKYKLIIIEDCCHTFSSEWNQEKVGAFSDASFFSFEWGKPISLGLGGAVLVNNKEILKNLEYQYASFSSPPIKTEVQLFIQRLAFQLFYRPSTYWFVKRMFHFFSSIGIIKGNHSGSDIRNVGDEFKWKISRIIKNRLLNKIKGLIHLENHSKWVVKELNERISSSSFIRKIPVSDSSRPTYIRYPLWVFDKEGMLQKAASKRIEIAAWYSTPVHPYVGSQLNQVGYEMKSCPNAELACRHVISLPLNNGVNNKYISSLLSLLENTNE